MSEAFATAAGVEEDKMPSTEALLERKWASLFRLQKKNGELEAKVTLLAGVALLDTILFRKLAVSVASSSCFEMILKNI